MEKISEKEWKEILELFGNKCAYCGLTEEEHIERFKQRLHKEHLLPIEKFGKEQLGNIVPACKVCNAKKNTKDFYVWYAGYNHYNHERANKIINYITKYNAPSNFQNNNKDDCMIVIELINTIYIAKENICKSKELFKNGFFNKSEMQIRISKEEGKIEVSRNILWGYKLAMSKLLNKINLSRGCGSLISPNKKTMKRINKYLDREYGEVKNEEI